MHFKRTGNANDGQDHLQQPMAMQGLSPYCGNRMEEERVVDSTRETINLPLGHTATRNIGAVQISDVIPECLSVAGSSISEHVSLSTNASSKVFVKKKISSMPPTTKRIKRTNIVSSTLDSAGSSSNPQDESHWDEPVHALKEWYLHHPTLSLLRGEQNFVHQSDSLNGVMVFTCYFVAPHNEFFPSGRLLNDDATFGNHYMGYHKGLNWYSTQAAAKKAAAGKALDCLKLRENDQTVSAAERQHRHRARVVANNPLQRQPGEQDRCYCSEDPYLFRQGQQQGRQEVGLPSWHYPIFARNIEAVLNEKILKHSSSYYQM